MRLTIRIIVAADIETLDPHDRTELGELLVAALMADDDESAWRPMVRARLLVERARLLAEQRR